MTPELKQKLRDNLAKARATRMANIAARKAAPTPTEKATAAANVRWSEAREHASALTFDWNTETLPACQEQLARLLASFNEGSAIVRSRTSTNTEVAYCEVCDPDHQKPLQRWASCITVRDPATQQLSNKYRCSMVCAERAARKTVGR